MGFLKENSTTAIIRKFLGISAIPLGTHGKNGTSKYIHPRNIGEQGL